MKKLLILILLLTGCETAEVKKFNDCKKVKFEKYCQITENGTLHILKELARAGLEGYTRVQIENLCEQHYESYGYDYRDSIENRIERYCK